MKRGDINGMSHFFDDLFTRDLMNWDTNHFSSTNTTIPAVNIRETGEHFLVEMAAPGMTREDFNVELDGNLLTISSEKKSGYEPNDGERFTRKEFSYQSFQRSFRLSKDVVDIEGINARYENGVLLLQIPKKEEAKQKPPRRINIS
jgi:HSP20 family protein